MAGHFLGQQHRHLGNFCSVFGLVGEVDQLVRVIREIEELGAIHERIADELPAIVADGALAVAVGGVEHVADFRLIAMENRNEAFAVDAGWNFRACEFSNGREQIIRDRNNQNILAVRICLAKSSHDRARRALFLLLRQTTEMRNAKTKPIYLSDTLILV